MTRSGRGKAENWDSSSELFVVYHCCLLITKEYRNMKPRQYDYLLLKQTYENGGIQQVEQAIEETAKSICDKREELSASLSSYAQETKDAVDVLNQKLDSLQQQGAPLKESDRKHISDVCSEIRQDLLAFLDTVNDLARRFINKKIRVCSVGKKSQGKSLFTTLIYGLEPTNPIVAVKSIGDDRDKTGTSVKYHYKKDVDPRNPIIEVKFLSKSSYLKEVNTFLDKLNRNVGGYGPGHYFSSIEEIKAFQPRALEAFSEYNETSAYKAALLDRLGQGVALDYLSTGVKRIRIEDLPRFSDMQYAGADGKCYPTVENIDIYFEMPHGNLFQYFELCDTKGSSINAGADVTDKAILRAIEESDAVFSIVRTENNDSLGIYSNLMAPAFRDGGTRYDPQSHFAIINVSDKANQSGNLKLFRDFIQADVCGTEYIGSLHDRPAGNYDLGQDDTAAERINPSKFAEYLFLDMLKRISKRTETRDKQLLQKCINDAASINEKLSNLELFLNSISPVRVDLKSLIIKALQLRALRVSSHLSERIDELTGGQVDNDYQKPGQKTSDSYYISPYGYEPQGGESPYANTETVVHCYDKEYKSAKEQGTLENTIYSALTQDTQTKVPSDEDIINEVQRAVDKLYGELILTTKLLSPKDSSEYIVGHANDVGRYIDEVVALFQNRLQRFNDDFLPQKPVNIDEDRNKEFDLLWKEMALDKILGPFNRDLLSADNNVGLQELLKIYDYKTVDTDGGHLQFFTSLDVLQSYFANKGVQQVVGSRENESDLMRVIDDNRLKEVIWEILSNKYNFPKLIIDKMHEKKKDLITLLRKLKTEFFDLKVYNKLYPIYSERPSMLGLILKKDDMDSLDNNNKWDDFDDARDKFSGSTIKPFVY